MRRLLALALLIPGAAHALEKCVAPDGSVSYVDVCPPGSKRAPSKTDPQLIPKPSGTLPRKPAAAAPPAAPDVPAKTARRAATPEAPVPADVRLQFYDLEAATFAAARNASPDRPEGAEQASRKLGYEYKVRQAPGGRCALDSLSTKLDLVLTLPRWKAPPSADDAELELWRHYVEALRLREDLRLDHAREFEQALPAQLLAIPPAESCNALEAAMRARYDALRAAAQARFSDHR